jgi:formate-dependent nitrite reductase membrane component NrfD
VAAVDAYHVCGIAFAVWAVAVSFLGITREDFPNGAGAQRAVAAISILLALATIGSAIYTGATEDEEPSGGEGHALVLPL